MGVFCCHGNQTKRQITIILDIFELSLSKKHSYQVRDKSLQWLWSCRLKVLTDGWTDGRTGRLMDDGQKVITIAHPEHSSGELININKRATMAL